MSRPTLALVSDDTIDVHDLIEQLCARLGLDPSYVSRIDIRPRHATVTLYRGRDGRCAGAKYIDDNGEPAVETLEYKVSA